MCVCVISRREERRGGEGRGGGIVEIRDFRNEVPVRVLVSINVGVPFRLSIDSCS